MSYPALAAIGGREGRITVGRLNQLGHEIHVLVV